MSQLTGKDRERASYNLTKTYIARTEAAEARNVELVAALERIAKGGAGPTAGTALANMARQALYKSGSPAPVREAERPAYPCTEAGVKSAIAEIEQVAAREEAERAVVEAAMKWSQTPEGLTARDEIVHDACDNLAKAREAMEEQDG